MNDHRRLRRLRQILCDAVDIDGTASADLQNEQGYTSRVSSASRIQEGSLSS